MTKRKRDVDGRWLAVVLTLMSACDARVGVPAKPSTPFVAPSLGVSFDLPADWEVSPEGTALVFAGHTNERSRFATLTLQASPADSTCAVGAQLDALEASLASSYEGSPELEHVRWRYEEVEWRGGEAALRYLASFELFEQPRWREGLLLCSNGALVALHYTAPRDLFAEGLAAWALAANSLSTVPADGAAW